MSDEKLAARIAEIRERESKAGKGPWKADWRPALNSNYVCANGPWYLNSERTHEDSGDKQAEADSQFIAHARADIPFLLEQLASERKPSGRPS